MECFDSSEFEIESLQRGATTPGRLEAEASSLDFFVIGANYFMLQSSSLEDSSLVFFFVKVFTGGFLVAAAASASAPGLVFV